MMYTAIIKDLVQVQRVGDSLVLQKTAAPHFGMHAVGRLPLHSDCNCIDVNPAAYRCMWFGAASGSQVQPPRAYEDQTVSML